MSTVLNKTLCLIEDDSIMGESLVHRLTLEGLDCHWYRDGESALAALRGQTYAALISDIRLPDTNGEDLFQVLCSEHDSPPPTLFITGYGAVDQAVRLLKLGARDYITKPFDLDQLIEKLQFISPTLFIDDEWQDLEPRLGTSVAMRRIQKMAEVLSQHRVSVLITGDSGAGKEYVAQYIHDASDDTGRLPFISINCAAVPETLLEANLFGHERGAFTGAIKSRRGVFERADGGTLFLDEIGDMSPGMQAKLLRVLQDGVFERVGGQQRIDVDVRVICATNQDLKTMVDAGKFRDDLFYRINVAHIHIPPLRDRVDDILWFAHTFINSFARKSNKTWKLAPAGEELLRKQAWPGNIRELKHTLERACIFATQTVLGPAEISVSLDNKTSTDDVHTDADQASPQLKDYLEQCEHRHIKEALRANAWQISTTAHALGISRKNLWEKMRKYGIRNEADAAKSGNE